MGFQMSVMCIGQLAMQAGVNALGADAVVVARPYVTAVYGGGAEGVGVYTEKLGGELADTMAMCGAHSLSEIGKDMVFTK